MLLALIIIMLFLFKTMSYFGTFVVSCFLMLLWPQMAISAKWQSHNSIQQSVTSFLAKKLTNTTDYEVTTNKIDSRLHLTQCSQDLEPFLPNSSELMGKITVGVRCQSSRNPWKIYVPAYISVYKSILVAAHPLPRGHQVRSGDIISTRVRIDHSTRDYFTQDQLIDGLILIRALSGGKPFKARFLQPPKLVKRGQEVILFAATSSIRVQMSGKALTDGAKGDLIQVRNNKTRRVVEGIVTEFGKVKVKM